jgi:hypothetical protein
MITTVGQPQPLAGNRIIKTNDNLVNAGRGLRDPAVWRTHRQQFPGLRQVVVGR